MSGVVFFDTAANLHPFECGGDCLHCRREFSKQHDPRTCALCDPEYDFAPNPYRDEEEMRKR